MSATRILTAVDVEGLVSMPEVVEAVDRAFRAMTRGDAVMPPKVYLDMPDLDGDFRAMPARLGGRAGVKWVNSHAENPARYGLPAVLGLYVLSDPANALPLAVMDGRSLTALRTGAAAGVASRALAKKSSKTLSVIGAGVQARYFVEAHRVYWSAFELLVADRDPETARVFAREQGGRVVSVEEAAGADVVCTGTPSKSPVVMDSWVRSGTHINAMGADAPGKQELETALLLRATVFIDDAKQAKGSGEINVPLRSGAMKEEQIAGTLGDVLEGKVAGRTGEEITIFDSTGLAVQDLAVASLVYERALAQNAGLSVDFFGL